jgi:CspA family cold shock protein
MPTGTVKWWNGEKGEGYAEQDGGGPDVYITETSLKVSCRSHTRSERLASWSSALPLLRGDQASGIRELVEGLRIYFKVTEGPKGLHAEDVEIS